MSAPAAIPPSVVEAERVDAALLRERLRLYETNVWPAAASQSAVALLVAGAFWQSATGPALATWLGAVMLSLGVRFVVSAWLRRARVSTVQASGRQLWAPRLAVAGSGAAWGLAGVLFYSSTDLQSQTLLAFVLAGVAAGSLSMTAFDLTAAFLFVALTLTPLGLRMVGTGSSADMTMGVMALLFVALLGLTGRRGQSQLHQMVLAREAERQRAESLLENQHRQQQLSDELRRKSEALTVTLDSMDQGILSLDRDGRTRFFNRRLAELLDIPESFFATRPTIEHIARYQLEHGHYGQDFALTEPALRDFLRRWFEGDQGTVPASYLRRTPRGTVLEVKSHLLPDGGVVRTFSDVTAFFEARERLLHSQAEEGKLALVAAHTDNAVAITDAGDRIEWINAAFTRMTGQSLERAAGRTMSELLRGADTDLDALRHMNEQLRREGKSASELRYQLKDGRVLWLAIETHAVLGPDGQVQHYLSIGRDITERHAAEQALRAARDEAERASRAKSEFLSAMSHELRTPMNAILGFAKLLEMDTTQPLPERHHRHVDQILRAGTHLLDLINDVLDLARVESGRQLISVEPVALDPLLQECVELMRPLAAERSIRLDGRLSLGIGCRVAADRTRLKQVLLNLLSNAVKYNRVGGEVCLIGRLEDDTVCLGIADTGQGLDAEQRARLFVAFDRLGAEDGLIPGAGIGLALSKRIVELMGGQIEVDSEAGRGSTFWLRLPLAGRAPATPAPSEAARPLPAEAPPAMQRVLYIEDNPVNLMLMEAVLEREPGVLLTCVPQPERGLDLAMAEPPDLVLLDIQMPDIDGFEVLRRLRAASHTRRVPVVAVSANAMPSDIERARAAGFDDYLTKPIDFDRLLSVVRRFRDQPHDARSGAVP